MTFIGSNRKCSVHEVSLIDLMAIALLSGQLPQQRALIGIQPHSIDWGETPSPPRCQRDPASLRSGPATRGGVARMSPPNDNLGAIPIYAQAEESYSVGNIRALLTEICRTPGKAGDTTARAAAST